MSRRTKYIIQEAPAPEAAPASANLLVGFIAGVMFGALGGYVLGSQALAPRAATAGVAPVVAVSPAAPVTHAANEQELQSFRSILANDPKNARAAVELGNRLYDAGRFAEAIPYYQQAFALNPKDINVSTDLGTSLWNSGRADEALAQFERSLAIDAKHPQTLFNIGIVRRSGKGDPAGAVVAWENLLQSNPSYPERTRVQQLITEARVDLKPVTGTR
jgi:cytochrome c-type biogenesis protein CcmH/NrfG